MPASPRLFLDGQIDGSIKLVEVELRRTAQEGERQIADCRPGPGCSTGASTLTFHFEAAQEAYKEAVRYFKREADSPGRQLRSKWAARRRNSRFEGKGKAANEHLTDAITAYRNALEVYTRERLPQVWAAVQTNLGNALQAQGLRTGVLSAMNCWPSGGRLPLRPGGVYARKLPRLPRQSGGEFGEKQRTCLNRRRPLSERDFPSLAYISSSRTRVLKHHPRPVQATRLEARPGHSLKSRTCRNTSCSPGS